MQRMSKYAKKNENEAFAETFAQLEAYSSGRWSGPLEAGARELQRFLSDILTGRRNTHVQV
jgi:hypothetical protein